MTNRLYDGTVRVYGIDFTGAPHRGQPITCAACSQRGDTLHVDAFAEFDCFEVFENFLGREGPWVAGLDFPFGQPRRLLEALGWPADWAGYVELVGAMECAEFEGVLESVRHTRSPGAKHPSRAVDDLADSASPPVLPDEPAPRLFFRGAPRLLRAGVSVLPCRPVPGEAIVVEAYPALVARKLIGERGYKTGVTCEQSAAPRAARRDLCRALANGSVAKRYGLRVIMEPCLADLLEDDPGADHLDALLCAVQAAWAWQRRRAGFGLPARADAVEGWIVDPETCA